MKHLLGFTLFGCLAASACASPQPSQTAATASRSATRSCQGPVTIARKADLTSVGTWCATIDGDLRIVETDLTNLDGLDHLQSVRNLIVLNNANLASLEGLRGLRAATGVTLMGNPSLKSREGLEGLRELRDITIVESGVTSRHRQPSDLLSAVNPVLE
jgi:hypothetical protein